MRKVRILGTVFFAVLAFGAISAANAFAAPEWLEDGKLIAAPVSAVTTGTWLLKGLGIFGIELHVECDGKLIGTVGAMEKDEITGVEDLSGNKTKLDCKIVAGEEALCSGSLALVTAVHLPWVTKLEAGDLDLFTGTGGEPGFTVECLLGGGAFSKETCEGNVLTEKLVNGTSGIVEGKVTNQLSKSCSGGNTGHVFGSGKTSLVSGKLLTVD